MFTKRRAGFTLTEVLIVLLIFSVLGFVIIPLVINSTAEENESGVRFNLQKLRMQLEKYRSDHGGRHPVNLTELTRPSDEFPNEFGGPYLISLPENPASAAQNQKDAVKVIWNDPPSIHDVTPGNKGGWLYNPRTGEVWIDHDQYFRF